MRETKIKRYDIFGWVSGDIKEDKNGVFIRYTDFKRVKEELLEWAENELNTLDNEMVLQSMYYTQIHDAEIKHYHKLIQKIKEM
jgi:hypothetical protein